MPATTRIFRNANVQNAGGGVDEGHQEIVSSQAMEEVLDHVMHNLNLPDPREARKLGWATPSI